MEGRIASLEYEMSGLPDAFSRLETKVGSLQIRKGLTMMAKPYSFKDSGDCEALETVLGLKVGELEHYLVDTYKLPAESFIGQATEKNPPS